MNTDVIEIRDPGSVIEAVIAKGDLAKLTPTERVQYYTEVCRSVGLNPLTKPLEYISLNGKLTLYALRGATDQLRAIHKVSVVDMTETERDGIYIVTCKVQNSEGRTDIAKGAVALSSLKGDALANAIMRCETKAKRRATLSICGLGLLDETEAETIPTAVLPPHDPETGEIMSDDDANQLLMEARSYAKLGQRELQTHWKSLGKPARRIVNTIMDELKVTATEADAMREPETTEGEI
jgi:hypothetical protein